ncbi:DNA-3-methyladenine glycosylase family protein [uncultured Methylobacterium sp.]|uniref:DNA-3-methyladenine glycosylase family protein n=1 Tax=uncultured Methylobacterium sp. TaxID=157278 RepID=UPI0035CB82ED
MHAVDLSYRPPYDWAAIHGFLAARAIPGIEAAAPGYARTVAIDGRHGTVAVALEAGDRLRATIRADAAALPEIVARLRRVFDCAADPAAIGAGLARDPGLAPLVAARPGLRVPGAWCGFELGVRAILGQQVSVAAATRLAGRLVAALGTPFAGAAQPGLTHVFPGPDAIASADIAGLLGMPRARGAAIRALAAASLAEPDLFAPGQDPATAAARLTAIRGIGPWTAQYVAMRALRDADALPVGDIGLMRALDAGPGRPSPAQLLARAEAWRPWRAYAAMHLWTADAERSAPA